MQLIVRNIVMLLVLSLSLMSCREEQESREEPKSEVERMMEDPANKVDVKDGGDKIKIETPEGKTIKIKKDDGEYKKKVEHADGSETKVKVDDGEVKVKTDN